MAVTIITPFVWAVDGSQIQVQPKPFITSRAPTSADTGPIGALWINSATDSVYALAKKSGGSTWVTSPASGVGTFTSVTVSPGDLEVDTGDTTLAGALNVAGLTTFSGDVNFGVGTTITVNGDLDLSSAAAIDLVSTANVDPAIYLHANGGIAETIRIRSDQGTGTDSIDLVSDVGGFTLTTGLASADAINFVATGGGIDADADLQINIDSAQAAATALRLVASDAAGGIDCDSGTGGTALDSTGAISLDAAAASNFSVSGAGIDLTLASAAGRVIMNGEEAAANAITLLSAAGGIDADCALQMNLASSQAAADAIRIDASDAAGGIDVDDGGGGMTFDSAGSISLDAAAASNMSVSGAGIDLTLASAAGRVVVDGGEAAADAVRITASNAAGGIDIDSGTGGIAIDSTDLFSIQGAAASDVSVSGAGIDLSLVSAAGRVIVNGEEAAANAVTLLSAAGGIDADCALQMNLDSSQAAAADSIRINASAADGGIDIDAGTGGIAIDSTGAVSIQGAAASDFSVSGAGIDLTLASAAGRVVVNGEEAAADAIRLLSAAGGLDADVALQMSLISSQAAAADSVVIQASAADGGIDCDSGTGGTTIDSTGAISIDGAAASNFSVSGAGIDLTLSSAAGRVVLDGAEAAANAITIDASDAAGGIDVDYGTGGMTIDGANGAFSLVTGTGAINVSADAAATTVNLGTGAAVKTVTLGSTNSTSVTTVQSGTGGLQLSSGTGTRGLVTVDPEVATEAAGASSTVNSNVIHVTFQGITTASGADEDITITSSLITTSSALMCNVATIGGGNDADLTIEGVRQSSGNVVLHCINSGAAAVNTDVHVTVWVLS